MTEENILKVSGVSRFIAQHAERDLLVSFNIKPNDKEFRAFHEYVRAFSFVRVD